VRQRLSVSTYYIGVVVVRASRPGLVRIRTMTCIRFVRLPSNDFLGHRSVSTDILTDKERDKERHVMISFFVQILLPSILCKVSIIWCEKNCLCSQLTDV